jgi:hypothetical protein
MVIGIATVMMKLWLLVLKHYGWLFTIKLRCPTFEWLAKAKAHGIVYKRKDKKVNWCAWLTSLFYIVCNMGFENKTYGLNLLVIP